MAHSNESNRIAAARGLDRREFVRAVCGSALATTLRWAAPAALAGIASETFGEFVPLRPRAHASEDQAAWQDLELGMFVHFAPNTWQDVESDNLSTPLSAIDPKHLDTDQWAQTAVALGAKYIVFVAKHQGGFCMW